MRRKGEKRNRKLKLQTRFFCAYLLMSLLIIGAFSVIFYRYTSEILIERETKSAISLNEAFLSQTERIIRDMDTVSINIGYSNLVKESLYDRLDILPGTDDFRNLANLFVTINGADIKVDQINLYDFDGHVVQVGIKSNTSVIDPDSLKWAAEADRLGGRKLLSLPYATTALASVSGSARKPVWYLSLYRTFYNKYKKPVGYIETVKKCSSVFKDVTSFLKRAKNPPRVYFYNRDGVQIYPYQSKDEPDMPLYFELLDPTVNNMRRLNEYSRTEEILVYETSDYTGYTCVTVQPESQILKPVYHLLRLLACVMAVMLLLCAFISYEFSRGLIRPIRRLRQIIRETVLDNLGQEENSSLHSSFDELEELNREFTQMSAKLKASMVQLIDTRAQEMKSRSLALQSQINPHFYYNTLSGIIVLAENGQNDEVVTMCRNLTKIMRYITDSHDSIVTVKDELSYIRQYLYCMKVRFQSSLNYDIRVEDSLLTEKIPRLLIQPLVENALKYGTDCAPPWYLSVTGEVTEDFWKIHVTDSGNGFTDEKLALIARRIHKTDGHPGMPEIQLDGMGLLNVYIRWKLFCTQDMIFEYGNTAEGHGIVSIGRKKKRGEEI